MGKEGVWKMKVFIPFNTPSSKNSKVATSKGVFHSKTVQKYLQKLGVKKYSSKGFENYKTRPNLFLKAVEPLKVALKGHKPPAVIGFFFIRNSRRKFDIINAMQIICDLLVAHGVVLDDDADHVIPIPININGKWYDYDKENPGVILYSLDVQNCP